MISRWQIGLLIILVFGGALFLYQNSLTEERDCPPFFYTDTSTDYEAILSLESTRLDDNGVVQYDYGTKYQNAGWQYTPYQISNLGVVAINNWCATGNGASLDIAKAQARWLIDNMKIVVHPNYHDGFGVWMYDFPNLPLHATGPWTSGFGNAYAIILLTQMYSITDDLIYKDAALASLGSFDVDFEEGGVRSTPLDGDGYWYEEVAFTKGRSTYIFNGHILTVFALDYVANLLDVVQARELADKGATAIADMYPHFDLTDQHRTLYSLEPPDNTRPVDHYAHRHHINGLYWLAAHTGDEEYFDVAEKWASWMDESIRPPVFTSTASSRE